MSSERPGDPRGNIRKLLESMAESERAEQERRALRQLLTPAQFAECTNVYKTSRLGGLDTSLADIAVRRGYVTAEVLAAGIRVVDRASGSRVAAAGGPAPAEGPSLSERAAGPVEEGQTPRTQSAVQPRAPSLPSEDLCGARFGSFELARLFSHGPLADTYLGRRHGFEMKVAVKVYPVERIEVIGLPNLLFDRMKKAGTIKHECLIQPLGCGRSPDNRYFYFATEFVAADNLSAFIAQHKRLDDQAAIAIITAAANGLKEAHERGMVHGNLKPSNILVTPAGKVLVTDLGMPRTSQFVVTEYLQGNGDRYHPEEVAFIPPELVEGQNLMPSADTYSLGVLLAYLLSGSLPFEGNGEEIIKQIIGDMNPLRNVEGAEILDSTRLVLETMITRVPGWRYEDMSELIGALKGAIGRPQSAGAPEHRPPAAAPPPRPRPAAPQPAGPALIAPEGDAAVPAVPRARPDESGAQWVDTKQGSADSGANAALVAILEEGNEGDFQWQSGTFPGLGSAIFRSSPNLLAVSSESLVGKMAGDWKLNKLLGHGVVADMYLASNGRDSRVAAVKVFLRQILDTEAAVRRYNSRCRAALKIEHGNMLRGYDYGQSEDGLCYFSMEYLKGRSLKKLIRRNGLIPEKMAVAIALFVARGLRCAHEKGIIHGNLKPSNILVNREGIVKCADTGLPRSSEIVLDESLASELPADLKSEAIEYICPEIVTGAGDLQPQADIYSLGMVLFHMLTGREPFKGTVREVLDRIRRRETPRFVSTDEGIAEGARKLVLHMIQPEVRDRPKNMGVVIEEARQVLDSLKGRAKGPRSPSLDDDAPSMEGIVLPPGS